MPLRSIVFSAVLLGLTGCATNFTGSPKFPGGARGCLDKCAREGMAMGAFVYAGEYSTACVCVPAEEGKSAQTNSAFGMAAVGVITQMRAAQQQQQHMSMMH